MSEVGARVEVLWNDKGWICGEVIATNGSYLVIQLKLHGSPITERHRNAENETWRILSSED